MKYSVAAVSALASVATAAVSFTGSPSGKPGDVVSPETLGCGADNVCTIQLQTGADKDHLHDVVASCSTAGGSTCAITIPADAANQAYAFKVIGASADDFNYANSFQITGNTNTAASTGSATGTATGSTTAASASTTLSVTGTTSHATTGTSSMTTSTPVVSKNSTTSTFTTPGHSTMKTSASSSAAGTSGSAPSSSSTTVPTSGAAQMTSSLALIAGAVMAMIYLN